MKQVSFICFKIVKIFSGNVGPTSDERSGHGVSPRYGEASLDYLGHHPNSMSKLKPRRKSDLDLYRSYPESAGKAY